MQRMLFSSSFPIQHNKRRRSITESVGKDQRKESVPSHIEEGNQEHIITIVGLIKKKTFALPSNEPSRIQQKEQKP